MEDNPGRVTFTSWGEDQVTARSVAVDGTLTEVDLDMAELTAFWAGKPASEFSRFRLLTPADRIAAVRAANDRIEARMRDW